MSFVKQYVTAVCAVALLLIGSATTAHAQATTGELTGRVTDGAGAVVPGVTVTLRSGDTGLVRTAVTNESGEYCSCPCRPAATPSSVNWRASRRSSARTCQSGSGPVRRWR